MIPSSTLQGENSQPPRLVTHKAAHKKSFAGCATCPRARHIKCPEERPQCSRCVNYGVSCPGYLDRTWLFEPDKTSKPAGHGNLTSVALNVVDGTGQLVHKEDQVSLDRTTQKVTTSNNDADTIAAVKNKSGAKRKRNDLAARKRIVSDDSKFHHKFPKILTSISSSNVMLREFQYFYENTIPSFLFVNPSPQARYVFSNLLPQAFHTEPAIHHSVVAIAIAHELVVAPPYRTAALEAILLQHYGKTLRILADPAAKPTVLVMLLACLVFVGLETFRNAPKYSSWHLENGLRILRQWKRDVNQNGAQTLPAEDEIISHYIEPVCGGAEAIFARSSVSDITPLGDLTYYPPVFPEEFSTVLEIRGKMLELWLYFLSKHPPDRIDAVEQFQVLHPWETWYVKVLRFARDSHSWPTRLQLQIRLLCVFNTMLSVALRCQRHRDETVWDKHEDDFQKMLEECYDICHNIETYQIVNDPNDMDFSILPGVLPPLWLIGMSCRDPILRRRAVELLRIHHRRCGETDQCSAVVLLETTIQLEEEGIPVARHSSDILASSRVRVYESDLTQQGKMVLTLSRAPYTRREVVEVPYVSSSTLPIRKYRLWPIVASMDMIGYQGLVRAFGRTCVCKTYGH